MTTTQDNPIRRDQEDGTLAMVHLRVADADRGMAFFGELFGWEAERVQFEDYVTQYVFNTQMTVALIDDRDGPSVTPNYRFSRVDRAVGAITTSGGSVINSEVSADGGGWARGVDDQGVPLLVYRYRGEHPTPEASLEPTGQIGLVFIVADAQRVQRFYGEVLGWQLERAHPTSNYFHAVPQVGVFDEAAAFGRPVAPAITLYISVPSLQPALRRVAELGGRAGEPEQTMGAYHSAVCQDDQGTRFGVMSERLE